MSLNGLDDARVKEAHEVAVTEPGGWFLLKYATRDEVDLLGRGNGGIVEIRNNIAQYEDKSPLYGFLRYRRRNVIIKYLPEGCSRLIQARVAVHFNAVCDRFSPHDTTFEIAEAKELKDTKLSAACSLHTASDSTSSSTSSLRRRRLMEIAEEEEEEERERKRQSIVKEEEALKLPTEPPVKLDADLAKLPEASRFANDLEPPHFMGVPRPSSPAKSFDESSRRLSSQTSRSDLYSTTSYTYKPRVRLGARPSADTGGRPQSSAGSAPHRPVATVPAGLKSMHKSSKKTRSQSQDQDEEAPETTTKEEADNYLPPIAADEDAKPIEIEILEPHTSNETDTAISTSASKPDMPAIAPPPSKQNTMTPEKARLLKAMKLREKKKLMTLQPTLDVPAADIPSAPSTPGLQEDTQDFETPEIDAPAGETTRDSDGQQDGSLAVPKADSGIEVDVGTDHASVNTHTDSHPDSPVAASDIGDSTQASSLSDSTDETVLAKDQDSTPKDGIDNSEPAASTQDSEALPANNKVSAAASETPDGQSDKIIVVTDEAGEDKQDSEVTAGVKIEQTGSPASATPTEGAVTRSPEPILSAAPPPSNAPEQDDRSSMPVEKATQPALVADAAETTPSDPVEGETASSPQIRIPVSRFSTRDLKSLTGPADQEIPTIVAQATDVGSVAAEETPPPVPEKDSAAEAAGTEQKSTRRKIPGAIQTNLDALENDKRRSILSLTENDGLMDELQSATVQQATPITVSKSPISPFFAIDASAKRAPGGAENDPLAPRFSRTVSNPVRNSFLAPGEASTVPARSVSSGTSYLQRLSQQQAADSRPKSSSKLGSSISQRIKALEQLSGAPRGVGGGGGGGGGGSGGEATPKERPSSTFFAVRKTSTREPSRPSSVVDGAGSVTGGRSPSPPPSRGSDASRVAGRGRSGSLVNRLSMFEGGAAPRGRPESVSVRARIVRDPNQPFPKGPESKAGSDYAPLNLRQSPLVVDVQNRMPSQSPARPASSLSVRRSEMPPPSRPSLLERRQSKEHSRETATEVALPSTNGLRPRRRSSLSVVKDFITGAKSPSTDSPVSPAPNLASQSPANPISRSPSRPPSIHQAGSLARRLSFSSRRSSIEQNTPGLPNSGASILSAARAVDAGTESESDAKSINGPSSPNASKSSRATRFMRRLSNTLVAGRKNGAPSISPTVAEENAAEVEAASRGSTATSAATPSQPPSIVAFMGDVNVQFPDNLLWKRRSICLDSQGFLILSAVSGTAMLPGSILGKDKHGALVKRYHMSDFKPPVAPDVELQELPNSVVLDLVDGSGLQIACEDRAGQMSILHILEEAHHSHTNFGR